MQDLGHGFYNFTFQQECGLPAKPLNISLNGALISNPSQADYDAWLSGQGYRAIATVTGPDSGYTALSWRYDIVDATTCSKTVQGQRLTAEIEAEQAAAKQAAYVADLVANGDVYVYWNAWIELGRIVLSDPTADPLMGTAFAAAMVAYRNTETPERFDQVTKGWSILTGFVDHRLGRTDWMDEIEWHSEANIVAAGHALVVSVFGGELP